MDSPSTNGTNGRGPGGRFAAGNSGGPGNPLAKRVARLRSALLRSVSPQDLVEVAQTLLRQAKSGDVASIRELLQRTLGAPDAMDVLARLDEIEHRVAALQRGGL